MRGQANVAKGVAETAVVRLGEKSSGMRGEVSVLQVDLFARRPVTTLTSAEHSDKQESVYLRHVCPSYSFTKCQTQEGATVTP